MIQRFLLAVLLLLVCKFSYAAIGCQDIYGSGQCVSASSATLPPNAEYWGVVGSRLVDNGGGYFACQFYTGSGDSWQQFGTCQLCQYPQVMVNGQCVDTTCQAPKEDDGNGGCKCPAGQIDDGNEGCKAKPDCSSKTAECSLSCGGVNGDMSGVAYFYCENSTAQDPSTQLFSGQTYACECSPKTDCPTDKIKVLSPDSSFVCKDPNPNGGCPSGSYYGDFQTLSGCIQPNPKTDPDEPPNNCLADQKPIYFGSTLYCQPKPNTSDCPAGTTLYLAIGTTKLCKAPDGSGNSPDTNGTINGTSTGDGNGTGGTGSGTGTGGDGGTGGGDTTGDKGTLTLPSGGKKTDFGAFKAGVMAQYERAKTAPIMGVGAQISTAFNSSGSCPQIAFDFFGSNITTTLHCQVFDSIKSYFSAFMYAAWAILALMVFRRV